jgi:hypothetical protein
MEGKTGKLIPSAEYLSLEVTMSQAFGHLEVYINRRKTKYRGVIGIVVTDNKEILWGGTHGNKLLVRLPSGEYTVKVNQHITQGNISAQDGSGVIVNPNECVQMHLVITLVGWNTEIVDKEIRREAISR